MVTSNYGPFHHDMDAPDHGRAFRVTDEGGLDIEVAAGRARIDQTIHEFAAETPFAGLAPASTYRVYITAVGVLTCAIIGAYPANSIPIAVVVTGAATITSITDERCFFYEDTAAGGGANTLDGAYDQGGPGAGRQINAQDGAVLINNPDVDAGIPNLELTRAAGDIAAQIIFTMRAVGDANFRFEMLGNGVMRWGTGAGAFDVLLERTGANRLGLAVGDIFEADTIDSRGGTQVSMEDGVSVPEFLGLPPALIGIVAGVAIPVRSHHSLFAQAGVADDLDTLNIAPGPAIDGDVCVIRPDTGDTITVKHNIGNLLCIGNADIVLDDDHDFCVCIYNATLAKWMCLGGAGVAAHNLLDGAVHPDTAAQGASVGSIIRGVAGPLWDELVIAIPGANLRNVLGVDQGDTMPSWKASLDGVNPADIAAAASPGVALISSHRDHVHAHPNIASDLHNVYALLAGRAGGQTLMGDTGAGGHLTLQSTANAARGYVRAQDDLQLLTMIVRDAGGTNRIQLNAASPNIRLTGDLDVSGLMCAGPGTAIDPNRWLVLDGANTAGLCSGEFCRVQGIAAAGFQMCFGLTGEARQSGTPGAGMGNAYGLYYEAVQDAPNLMSVLAGIYVRLLSTAGSGAISLAYGIQMSSVGYGGGIPVTSHGIDIGQYGAAGVGTAYGIKIADQIGTISRLLECGPANPYLRLIGNAVPGANLTNLYLNEGGNLRRVQWKDGAAIGAGDKVMVLV